ncbi:GTP-binding protein YchF [Halteromyces radiatus]|uniref:GTP-binding protein YchF n=1 Tax=Halteromyces radiatus TaxID=101107 RepID=UPI00222026FE|nr:GTP-binding protein YchF [Halteromyces radiatus]KAI8089434.1 GTP-binding protein YchF [Halteromyces radiatus]
MGVVGLPNIGKSSLFNALTNSSVPAENYPFCTIDPSEALVQVPDTRFDWLCNTYQPNKITPAHLTVLDIAGLVRGAAQGAGLGNAFLANVGSVDGLYHLVRAFEDDDVTHVENTVDPRRDLGIIQDELRLKDEESMERTLTEWTRLATKPSASRTLKDQLQILEQVTTFMANGTRDVRKGQWTQEQAQVINSLHLLTAKPMVYLCNVSMDDYLSGVTKDIRWLTDIQEWVNENNPGDIIIPLSVSFESKISEMGLEERTDYLASVGVESQLPKVILAGYKALHLIHYFTCGPQEVRAWSVRDNSKAPEAAGVIHTDFTRGFTGVEIMKYNDLYQLKTEAAVRSAGKLLQKGKDYIIEDGDIAHFKVRKKKIAYVWRSCF